MTDSVPSKEMPHSLISSALATPALRADRWLSVLSLARTWADSHKDETKAALVKALADLKAVERFFAYPGVALLDRLNGWLDDDDARAFLRLAQRISTTIISKKYHRDVGAWNVEELEDEPLNRLPQAITHVKSRPYF